jgi:hypothetical protein
MHAITAGLLCIARPSRRWNVRLAPPLALQKAEVAAMQGEGFENSNAGARGSGTLSGGIADAASGAYARAAELTGEAAERARRTAADAASTAGSQMKDILDRQVGTGAGMLGDVARSVHRAADDLDQTSPLVGDLVRTLAQRMSGYADDLRGQTSDDLLRAASDLTRRQPALVFGLAALAGFFAFRTVKHAPIADLAPSLQPSQRGFGNAAAGM